MINRNNMNNLRFFLRTLWAAFHLSAPAINTPTVVQDSLKRMYPSIETVAWSIDDYFYVAGFQADGFPTKVWLGTKGHWVMRQTDWQTMDQVPMPVYHTFTFGPYSTDQVDDVTLVEFASDPPQIVILISPPNSLTQYQLFYTPEGKLINARNVTNMSDILGIATFL